MNGDSVPEKTSSLTLEELLPKLRCPATGAALEISGDCLVTADGAHRYAVREDGIADLFSPPERLSLDLPWYEPWDDLDSLTLGKPAALSSPDLPYHLHAELAGVPGAVGDGRSVLEVGCGERQCDAYFTRRGFSYVGVDVDIRGIGPHLLADAHNLPFASESFDFYTSMAVYEHLVSPLQAATEAFRLLKPGGTFFGSSAFVYGFHDRASFHHMTHGGLLWTLRMAGFTVERMWSDWHYTHSIAEMGFGEGAGRPWRLAAQAGLTALDKSFVWTSQAMRKVFGKQPIDLEAREVEKAGSVSFIAHRPRD
ncbi:MAG: class I SAM-dependent methyltransferase [Myxococcota bacterium]